MITKSTLLHVRLPFSFFLLPVYLLAVLAACPPYGTPAGVAGPVDAERAVLVFFVLHFLLYTASNGFNSYYDRDRESIGALRQPPPVTPDLLWFSLGLDAAALLLAWRAGGLFFLGCFLYGLASKAYSYTRTRIKKYPVAGWLFTGLGQGTLTFLLVLLSVGTVEIRDLGNFRYWFPAAAAGVFLLGFYPLTQVYQHGEDGRRGDLTISRRLGVRGTFYLAAPFMVLALGAYFFYIIKFRGPQAGVFFGFSVLPAAAYFVRWTLAAVRDPGQAGFDWSMRLCALASGGLNVFCIGWLWTH